MSLNVRAGAQGPAQQSNMSFNKAYYNATIGVYRPWVQSDIGTTSFEVYVSSKGDVLHLECMSTEDHEDVAYHWSKLDAYDHVNAEQLRHAIQQIRAGWQQDNTWFHPEWYASKSTPTVLMVANIAQTADSRITCVTDNLRSTNNRVDRVAKDIARAVQPFNAVQTEVNNLKNTIAPITQDLQDVKTRSSSASINETINRSMLFTDVRQRTSEIEANAQTTRTDVALVKQEVAALKASDQALQTRTNALDNDIAQVRVDCTEHTDNHIGSLRDEVEVLRKKMEANQDSQDQKLQSAITKLQTKDEELTNEIDALKRKHNDEIAALKREHNSEIAALRRQVKEVLDSQDRKVQSTMAEMQTINGRTAAALDAVNRQRDALQDSEAAFKVQVGKDMDTRNETLHSSIQEAVNAALEKFRRDIEGPEADRATENVANQSGRWWWWSWRR